MPASRADRVAAVGVQVYDQERVATTVTPTALTATGNSAAFDSSQWSELLTCISVSAVSGTTPSATFTLQSSPDGGTTWFPVASTAAITAAGTALLNAGVGGTALFGHLVRLAWVITGTTPSFTTAAWFVGKRST